MQGVLYAIAIVLGASVGSFVAAAAERFGRGESALHGRSKCRGCGKALAWHELIPIVSYLVQRGRCRSCRAKIGWETIAVEVAFVFFFLAAARAPMLEHGGAWELRQLSMMSAAWLAIAVLGALFLIDLKYGVVPDAVTLPAIAAFIPLSTFVSHIPWQAVALGGAIGAGFFFLQWAVSRGRWVGSGDIRLGALSGVLLGWKGLLAALLVAYVSGAVVSLFLLATKRVTMKSKVPFGPFLAGATILMLVFSH